MSSTTISLLATTAECACCAANSVSLLKIKKMNAICIGCCCLLSIGGLSLSSYFIYKFIKLKKCLNNFEKKVEELTEQLKFLNNEEEEDEIELEKEEKFQIDEVKMNNRGVKKNNNNQINRSNSIEAGVRQRFNCLPRCASVDTLNDNLDSFETPCGTPLKSTSLNDVNNNNDTMNDENLQAIERKIIDLNNLDDNRTLDLIVMQSYENKKVLCSTKKANYEQDPNDLNNLIDYIKCVYILAESESDNEEKKTLHFEAYNLAKKCLELYPDSYLSQKWFAMTTGRIIDYLGINDKVKHGFDFKKHLDIAIKLNESDYLLYYMRGRWAFKMCNLNWAERYGIRLVFGRVPDISIEDAMDDFCKVEILHKNKSKGNLLHLAKCLINKKESDKALECLQVALDLPTRTTEHEIDNREIISLMKKLES